MDLADAVGVTEECARLYRAGLRRPGPVTAKRIFNVTYKAVTPEDMQRAYDASAKQRRKKQRIKRNPIERERDLALYHNLRRNIMADLDSWAAYVVKQVRYRSLKQKLPFNLTPSDIKAALPPDTSCPVLGIPLSFDGKVKYNTPSLDRHIPKKGYVAGNVSVISYRANVLKRDSIDPEEFRRIAAYMDRVCIS